MDESHYSIDMLKKVAFKHEIDNVLAILLTQLKSPEYVNCLNEVLEYFELRIKEIDEKYKNL